MIKKPPPAPKNPVIHPTKKPITAKRGRLIFVFRVVVSDFRIIDTEVAIINNAKTIMMSNSFDTSKVPMENNLTGMAGNTIFRINSKETTEGKAKFNAGFIFRFPNR